MFIEVTQYSGDDESRCPFCRDVFGVIKHIVRDTASVRAGLWIQDYVCRCNRCDHYVFVTTFSENTPDEYKWHKYVYVFADEWKNHQSISYEFDNRSRLGELFFDPIIADEDELWAQQQRHHRVFPKEPWFNNRWLQEIKFQRHLKKKLKSTSKSS